MIFPARVLRAIDEAIGPAKTNLLAGQPHTLEDYRQAVGYLAGLNRARQEVVDLIGPEELPHVYKDRG